MKPFKVPPGLWTLWSGMTPAEQRGLRMWLWLHAHLHKTPREAQPNKVYGPRGVNSRKKNGHERNT